LIRIKKAQSAESRQIGGGHTWTGLAAVISNDREVAVG